MQYPVRSKTRLRVAGHSSTAGVKTRIRALLRQLASKRDGGCVLRHYPEPGGAAAATRILGSSSFRPSISLREVTLVSVRGHAQHRLPLPAPPRLQARALAALLGAHPRHIGPERVAWLDRVEVDKQMSKRNSCLNLTEAGDAGTLSVVNRLIRPYSFSSLSSSPC